MLDWIKKNKKVLKIRAINTDLGMPDSTLQKAVDGSQKLSTKWEDKLNDYVKKLRK